MIAILMRSGFVGVLTMCALFGTIGLAGLVVRMRNHAAGPWLAVAGMWSALCVPLVGSYFAWESALADTIAVTGETVDPGQRERILRETFHDTDPYGMAALVLGTLALGCAAGAAIYVYRFHRKRAATLVAFALTVPTLCALVIAHRFSNREASTHRTALVEAFDSKRIGPASDTNCIELEGALEIAKDEGEARSMLPDVRPRAHACLAEQLECLGHATCANGVRAQAQVYNQLHPHEHVTPLGYLARSPLLLDADQKADIASRMTHDTSDTAIVEDDEPVDLKGLLNSK